MVVKKEFAVLYKRKIIDENCEEFIPYKVIEGYFHEEDHWFIDLDDIVYPHIAEPMVSGIAYGNRVAVEKEGYELNDKYIETFKEEWLKQANECVYLRDRKEDNYIHCYIKETETEYIFEDNDTEMIYKQYENLKNNYDNQEEYEPNIKMTPLEIKEEVTKTIRGQDEAVKKIVTSLWTTIKFANITKKNMLVIGPSGVGKTAIFEKLQKILDLPLTIFPVPGLSQAGYVGRSVDEILLQVYYDNDQNISRAEHAIVILDEIDKLAFGEYNSGDISTSGVQNELLKIIEGCKRVVTINEDEGNFSIDTSKIIFIGTGAFSELHEKKHLPVGFNTVNDESTKSNKINTEKLINYGMKRELIGRLPVVVELNAMSKEILKDIILNSDESELNNTLEALASLGITVANFDEIIDIIVNDALNKGIGARGLVSTINDIFYEIFYEVANNPNTYNSVIIGKNILSDGHDFKLIFNKVKKKIKE